MCLMRHPSYWTHTHVYICICVWYMALLVLTSYDEIELCVQVHDHFRSNRWHTWRTYLRALWEREMIFFDFLWLLHRNSDCKIWNDNQCQLDETIPDSVQQEESSMELEVPITWPRVLAISPDQCSSTQLIEFTYCHDRYPDQAPSHINTLNTTP